VLEREDILSAPAPETLDLLRELPSIDFSRDSNTLVAQPRDQAISFRGMVGSVQSRALTLVDGVPIVDPYGGWLNFGEVPKELVDRIEVVRGGGSSAWGNLALSGVINLITRAPSSRELGGTFRAGDRSTGAADLYYTDAGSRWEGWIAGDALTTDGWIDAAAPYRGAADEALFRSTRSLHGRLGYTLSPSTHVTFRGMLYRDHQGQGLATDRADYRESSGAATLDQVRSDRSSWQLQVFHRRLGESSTAGNLSLDHQSVEPSNAVVALPERSSGVGGTWSSTLGTHALTAGADVVENRIERVEDLKWDGSIYTSRYDVRGEQRLGGVFVQDAITLSSRASVQVGARFDRVWSGDATSVRSSLITGEITGSDPILDHAERAFDPSLGFVFATSRATRLRGALYTGFRYGTPSELFAGTSGGGRTITVPNSSLKPERLTGAELGVDFTPSRRTTLRLTLFRNQIRDLMQRILVGTTGEQSAVIAPCGLLKPNSQCLQRQNLGRIRSTGLEVGAELRPSDAWRLTLDATLMQARVVDNPSEPALVGHQVERAPDRQIVAAVERRSARLGDLVLGLRYVSAAYDDAENTQYLPAHGLVDLGYSRQISGRFQLFAGVENLLDRRYVNRWTGEGSQVSAPRLLHAGVRFRLGGER